MEKYIKISKIAKKNINTTTKEDLQQIRGIDSVLADKIIKYRDKHGGFADIKHMRGVGLSNWKIKNIEKYFFANASDINKIDINNASIDDLKKFIGLNDSQVRSIVNFRKKFRDFKSVEELSKLEGF